MKDIWRGGVPLGFESKKTLLRRKRKKVPLGYQGDAPVAIYGPPGTKKTVGVVMNQLLSDTSRHSYFVPDYKGEIYKVTREFRRSLPGHRVRVVNAFNLLDVPSEGWNPLPALNLTNLVLK